VSGPIDHADDKQRENDGHSGPGIGFEAGAIRIVRFTDFWEIGWHATVLLLSRDDNSVGRAPFHPATFKAAKNSRADGTN